VNINCSSLCIFIYFASSTGIIRKKYLTNCIKLITCETDINAQNPSWRNAGCSQQRKVERTTVAFKKVTTHILEGCLKQWYVHGRNV
jgi:hypothetical protein